MENTKPNVLWIMLDQLGRQSLSCYGSPNITTTNIDRLASEGVICNAAISNHPVCTPFRAGLITGQYSHINRVLVHGDMLLPNSKTIAHAFKDSGYRTSYVGKWHLASSVSDQGSGDEHWVHPHLRGGFEDWYGFDVSNNFYNTHYSHGESCVRHKVEGHQTDGLTDISLEYLREYNHEKPWFHVLSLEAPHSGKGNGSQKYATYPASPKYEEYFNPEKLIIKNNVPDDLKEQAALLYAGYNAMISQIDFNIGRIIDLLEKQGELDNTLIVLFSDHGDMLLSQRRYQKQLAYEESIGIPLIMRLPSKLPVGSKYLGLISGIDIYPTTAGICGVCVPADVQGLNLSNDIIENSGAKRSEVLVQWMGQSRYGFGDHPYRAIRNDRYTYCVGSNDSNPIDKQHIFLLFDNINDPLQQRNLFGLENSIEIQQKLHKQLCDAIINSGEEVPDFVFEMSKELNL